MTTSASVPTRCSISRFPRTAITFLKSKTPSIEAGRISVYRIEVGELPFITGIFPLGGQAGTQSELELTGWNLPLTRLKRTNEPAGGMAAIAVRKDQRLSNHVPFAVNSLPESLEQEPNNLTARAQSVTLPIILNGRIDEPGDHDIFRFDASAGQEIVAEVYARRLDSPLDSALKLTGRQRPTVGF